MKKLSLALLLTVQPAVSEPITGNQLLAICSSEEMVQQGFCAGYVVAMIEGLAWGSTMAAARLKAVEGAGEINDFNGFVLGYCIPSEADNAQIADVVIKSLNENPSTRHLPARGLMTKALNRAYPCAG